MAVDLTWDEIALRLALSLAIRSPGREGDRNGKAPASGPRQRVHGRSIPPGRERSSPGLRSHRNRPSPIWPASCASASLIAPACPFTAAPRFDMLVPAPARCRRRSGHHCPFAIEDNAARGTGRKDIQVDNDGTPAARPFRRLPGRYRDLLRIAATARSLSSVRLPLPRIGQCGSDRRVDPCLRRAQDAWRVLDGCPPLGCIDLLTGFTAERTVPAAAATRSAEPPHGEFSWALAPPQL